jgi:hypothetical protein
VDPFKIPTNPQEALDRVWQYFIVEQNPFGYDEAEGSCKYRTRAGERCAVGCMIPDESYSEEYDEGYYNLDGILEEVLPEMVKHFTFLCALQSHHDSVASYEEGSDRYSIFKMRLAELANSWNLTIPEVQDGEG